MEFVLMRLTFSDPPSGENSAEQPIFSRVTEFRTMGVVMNIFLLDPSERLLSAFVWVASSNTIGLYALLDWKRPEYTFIDTGIEYAVSANWSCILYDEHIVIHCEEPESAHQHFYPFSLLRAHSAYLPSRLSHPKIIGRVPPARTLTKKFVFPRITYRSGSIPTPGAPLLPHVSLPPQPSITPGSIPFIQYPHFNPHTHSPPQVPLPNPFPFPTWIPRVSCTVVLLAMHDQETHRNRFVLAQHYFKVPIDWGMDGDDELMKMWYVRKPFKVVRMIDERDEDDNQMMDRPRPLVAVDFGHAVWNEYDDKAPQAPPPPLPAALVNFASIDAHHHHHLSMGSPGSSLTVLPTGPEPDEPKVLKFVTFPGYEDGLDDEWVEEEVEEQDGEREAVDVDTKWSGSGKGKGKGKQKMCDEDLELMNDERMTRSKSRAEVKGKGKEKPLRMEAALSRTDPHHRHHRYMRMALTSTTKCRIRRHLYINLLGQ
ncbi:hypothetical protein AN958_07218 [Leucoagaricus sp. SymC.cos]|nr:hypothetical protein AN958_07218 [Leucoagaricus sp. SymC.cos]